MLQLIFSAQYGKIKFESSEAQLNLLGYFFVTDIAFMPDFMRAMLASPVDEHVTLEATSVTNQSSYVIINSLREQMQIKIKKDYLLGLLAGWEQFMHLRQPSFKLQLDESCIEFLSSVASEQQTSHSRLAQST